MKKYEVIVRTEEMRGRMNASRIVKCFGRDAAEKQMEREYSVIARRHRLSVDHDVSDDERILEYADSGHMRTTITIKEVG